MKRLIFGTISVIILFVVFAFLWISNPLYAFVGGIVFLVFMVVGFAFFMNLPESSEVPVDDSDLKPRRSGQYRRSEYVEKPEDAWEQPDTSSKENIEPAVSSPPQVEPEPHPIISPGGSQTFGAVPPPAPVAPLEPEPVELPKQEETRKMDTANFFGVKGNENEEEAKELSDLDMKDEIVEEEETEFEHHTGNIKRKMEEGTPGNSPVELEDFFKEAVEKALARTEMPDNMEEDLDSPGKNSPEVAPEPASESEMEIEDESIFIDADLGDRKDFIFEPRDRSDKLRDKGESKGGAKKIDAVAEEEPAEPAELDSSDATVTRESGSFDLMGMVSSLPADKQQEFFALMTEVPIGEKTETQLMRLYQELIGNDGMTDKNRVSEAQFTAYYPRQVAAGTEYGFYVYAHLPDALINADIQQFESDLGGRVPKPNVAQEIAKIEEGANLGVVVYCDKLNFNRAGAIQQWKAPFVRFDFRFTADEAQVDEIVPGRIAIMLGIIEVASIDFQLSVMPANPLAIVTSIPHDPLTAHDFDSTAPATIYQKIFISYSRKDTIIAEQYRKVQTMAGNITFMDTHSIRAGQDWEVALKQFIDESDVFQLFWSEHSAISDHVKFEWDYALTQRCPETRCVQFIRPAYWQKPLPQIPSELNHLHFAFVEMEND